MIINLFKRKKKSNLVIDPKKRPLYRRSAETSEGIRIIQDAIRLSYMEKYSHMTDGELLRLAYWGASGRNE